MGRGLYPRNRKAAPARSTGDWRRVFFRGCGACPAARQRRGMQRGLAPLPSNLSGHLLSGQVMACARRSRGKPSVLDGTKWSTTHRLSLPEFGRASGRRGIATPYLLPSAATKLPGISHPAARRSDGFRPALGGVKKAIHPFRARNNRAAFSAARNLNSLRISYLAADRFRPAATAGGRTGIFKSRKCALLRRDAPGSNGRSQFLTIGRARG